MNGDQVVVNAEAVQQAFAAQQAAAHEVIAGVQIAANDALANMQQQLQATQQQAALERDAFQQQIAALRTALTGNAAPQAAATGPMQADLRLPAGMRLPALDTFAGRKGEDLEAFLFQLNEHMDATGVRDNTMRMRIAGMSLRGSAKTWYAYVRNPSTPVAERVETYEEFVEGLRAHFTPMDPVKIARDQLADLKQTGSVRDYTARFRELNTRIPKMSEDERLDRYVRGLKPRTRREVEIREPATYNDAAKLAEKLDIAMERAFGDTRKTYSYPNKQSPGSDPMPMVLGAMQTPPPPPKPNSKGNLKHKGRLTPAERNRRKELNLCSYCGSKDHAIDACPLPKGPRPNQGPRPPGSAPGNGQQRPRGA